ncbi:hypothetical protein P4639_22650 [Priestia megaterium]|uniref:hypothetical protein n=1 Tax=Priestia megaterium TaxID=1404 RepID=UPI002E1DA22D|nr:hypothetical protein [Priestia megaterium]
MATSFSSIYAKFLGLVDDYELAIPEDEQLTEVLFGYLDMARSLYFPQCKKDLDKVTLGENGLGEFTEDLTSQEQFILALGMTRAWIAPKLKNADLMSKAIGDRDYKAVQGNPYLKQLGQLELQIDKEVDDYATAYTWRNLSLEEW